jgi:hypothetical protein
VLTVKLLNEDECCTPLWANFINKHVPVDSFSGLTVEEINKLLKLFNATFDESDDDNPVAQFESEKDYK